MWPKSLISTAYNHQINDNHYWLEFIKLRNLSAILKGARNALLDNPIYVGKCDYTCLSNNLAS